jgi:hypothetical protein
VGLINYFYSLIRNAYAELFAPTHPTLPNALVIFSHRIKHLFLPMLCKVFFAFFIFPTLSRIKKAKNTLHFPNALKQELPYAKNHSQAICT